MKTYVVKIGGVASDQLNAQFFSTIRKWQAQGIQIVIIHGGGHYITELMEQFQIKRQIKNGLRVTDETTLELTKMALLGQVRFATSEPSCWLRSTHTGKSHQLCGIRLCWPSNGNQSSIVKTANESSQNTCDCSSRHYKRRPMVKY